MGKPRRADLTVGRPPCRHAPRGRDADGACDRAQHRQGRGASVAAVDEPAGTRTPLRARSVAKLKRGEKHDGLASPSTFPKVIAPGRYRDRRLRRRGQEGQGAQRDQQLPHAVAGARGGRAVPAPPARRRRRPRRGPPAGPTPRRPRRRRPRRRRRDRHGHARRPRHARPGEVPPEDLPPLIPSFADQRRALYAAQDVAAGAIAADRAGILHGRTLQRNGAAARGRARQRPRPSGARLDDDRRRRDVRARRSTAARRSRSTTARPATSRSSATSTPTSSTGAAPTTSLMPGRPGRRRPEPAGGRGLDRRAGARTATTPTGTRTSTLLFAPGTTATMHFADGTHAAAARPVDGAPDRVHGGRPAAMPGDLPATSGYTYAAELPIDEAEAAGASPSSSRGPRRVHAAAVNYVENFIGAPVGTNVPTGAYDREDAAWEPSPDGPRREGDLRDRRDGRPRHRRRRRQRRRRLPGGAEAHRRRAHGARAAVRARRRAVARPDPAPVAVGPQLAVRAPARRPAAAARPGRPAAARRCQQAGSSTIDCEDQTPARGAATSPARRTRSRTRRTGSRARPTARSTSR